MESVFSMKLQRRGIFILLKLLFLHLINTSLLPTKQKGNDCKDDMLVHNSGISRFPNLVQNENPSLNFRQATQMQMNFPIVFESSALKTDYIQNYKEKMNSFDVSYFNSIVFCFPSMLLPHNIPEIALSVKMSCEAAIPIFKQNDRIIIKYKHKNIHFSDILEKVVEILEGGRDFECIERIWCSEKNIESLINCAIQSDDVDGFIYYVAMCFAIIAIYDFHVDFISDILLLHKNFCEGFFSGINILEKNHDCVVLSTTVPHNQMVFYFYSTPYYHFVVTLKKTFCYLQKGGVKIIFLSGFDGTGNNIRFKFDFSSQHEQEMIPRCVSDFDDEKCEYKKIWPLPEDLDYYK